VSPETELGEAEERALLPALLATLPPAERRLLERYYFAGESLAQAAASLGLPTSTASRVHGRALDALRRQLRPSDTI
jgi:RNA polymerase sigma factor (sigma-70 family)